MPHPSFAEDTKPSTGIIDHEKPRITKPDHTEPGRERLIQETLNRAYSVDLSRFKKIDPESIFELPHQKLSVNFKELLLDKKTIAASKHETLRLVDDKIRYELAPLIEGGESLQAEVNLPTLLVDAQDQNNHHPFHLQRNKEARSPDVTFNIGDIITLVTGNESAYY